MGHHTPQHIKQPHFGKTNGLTNAVLARISVLLHARCSEHEHGIRRLLARE